MPRTKFIPVKQIEEEISGRIRTGTIMRKPGCALVAVVREHRDIEGYVLGYYLGHLVTGRHTSRMWTVKEMRVLGYNAKGQLDTEQIRCLAEGVVPKEYRKKRRRTKW